MDKTEVKDELSTLKKKRKRAKNMKDIPDGEEEEKTEKENIKNYLEFTPEEKYDIYNKYSDIEPYLVARKIYSTTSRNNYNYICQDINPNSNIFINDAKILFFENKTILFLLSNDILYIYEIKQNYIYKLIKEISFNDENKLVFSVFPKNIFFVTPLQKKIKNKQNNNNVKKVYSKDILYLCILSKNEKYLCSFELKKYTFKVIKNFMKKNMPKKLVNNDVKFKLYFHHKILSYNENCIYMQRIYGSPRFKDFKISNIESISLLNKNLFSICTPSIVYIYDTSNENFIGDFRTHGIDKKVKLIKPDNNLLIVKSKWDIALYDLESLMIFQKLDLSGINNIDEPIKKVKQLTNNNIVILFSSCFVIYNLEKNSVTYKCNYFEKYQNDNFKGFLFEIHPNFILVNNDEQNFYIMNTVKGDKIASLNINNSNFSLCKNIKRYIFNKENSQDMCIEEDKNNNNYFLLKNGQNSFILSSIQDEK